MESTSIGDYEASDASRCAPSSITGYETDNYWQRDELSRIERVGATKKKKKRVKRKNISKAKYRGSFLFATA